ncbi:LacI family DNA-binding transcriptional regulator [Enterococcus hulanensis]|uniref:LacI family DNA-binding transcriptional regulator n=1 Tax=Enterococcus hulanensis TaxID=2559929 RepID=UPI001A8E7CF0|nr:LacI family DNA-binding transcriptional regulator [Enterococcus hulanensis]MBO0455355.1 LacI family DNA-binding transcriptional regulator [Enterococcus hulanensis]
MSRVTIKDIAEKAGVSKTIVSQYLNNNYKFMGEDTRKRIEAIVKETNYIPKSSARNLKFKKITVIHIIVANVSSAFSNEVIKYINRIIGSSTVQVIVSSFDDNPQRECDLIEQAISLDVDGIILFPSGKSVDHYQMLQDKKIPVVYVDRIPFTLDNYYCVLLNNKQAIDFSIEALVNRGHQEIAYVGLPVHKEITPRYERVAAFEEKIKDYRNVASIIIEGDEKQLGQSIAAILNKKEQGPTAFIASNDTCLEILLREYKKSSPKHKLDIVSIDGYEIYTYIEEIIMTIEHPIEDICEQIILGLGLADKPVENEGKQLFRFSPRLFPPQD